ncbi:MAG: PEP-CTERM sorting domain-containing protein, partial [Kiritimatiellaeota bacterium]|nr:PEP-CTERM sorting domain-containing protein [Kiritimatiellota bacterium]
TFTAPTSGTVQAKIGLSSFPLLSGVVVTTIPEPSTLSLVGMILAGLMLRRRMRKSARLDSVCGPPRPSPADGVSCFLGGVPPQPKKSGQD